MKLYCALLVIVFGAVASATQDGAAATKALPYFDGGQPPNVCRDANRDGLCDHRRPPPLVCIDADRDGRCDNRPNWCIDKNRDGRCDGPRQPPHICRDADRDGRCDRLPNWCIDRNRDGLCDRHRPPPVCFDHDRDGRCDNHPNWCIDRNRDGLCDGPRPHRPPPICRDADRDGFCDRPRPPPICRDRDRDGRCDDRPNWCIDMDRDGRCDRVPRPCQCQPTCIDSDAWRAADERARTLEERAAAAKRRLDALNEASARARADPHYVYQGVSPYHLIKGAEAEWNRARVEAENARKHANSLCPGGDGFFVRPGCEAQCGRPRPRPPPVPVCDSEAGRSARERANAAQARLDALRDASARARADPHYVYQGVSPYHLIKGAEAEFTKWDIEAKKHGC